MMLVFPSELPITAWRAEIERTIKANAVTVICGDTGSGKTTQLPKMLLELGLGDRGQIACTQPRRLPAVAMARRVAAELGEEVGATVGFQHRFARCVSPRTKIKFMTDGVLLSELKRDRLLRHYSAIIIDEAHERSLNIDMLLGFLKRILEVRKDLKVVISSATIDTGLFSGFFGNAPVIAVPGRRHPVEIRYMPPLGQGEADLSEEVRRAVASLPATGDILVFLPGERDIREAREVLGAPGSSTAGDEILPLTASLPAAEQQRAFKKYERRKIILATNVAETSLTIPGVVNVVDSGLARISRFIHRSGVQRLQIEPISKASANQRAGRCGRVAPGVCIRLYSEEDFLRRFEFTQPEILRSSLAGAVLSLLDLGVREIAAFPFVTPPERAMIRNALAELAELGAIEEDVRGVRLTELGRDLAVMPVEPRIGRMILAAAKERATALVIPVAAYLSCEDPRRCSIEERERAKEAYAKFKAPASDFASVLKMWQWWKEQSAGLSQNKRRKLCKANYLSCRKMAEWQDVAKQLETVAGRMGIDALQESGGDVGLHRAMLAGLLAHTGRWHEGDRIYRGAHGAIFSISPGSVLRKATPPWIVAAELIDTRRPLAATVAGVEPEWIEELGAHLCRHSYRDPFWDAEAGFVRAFEDVTIFGQPLAIGRRCDFSRVEPAMARDIFIRRGLIDGEIANPPRIVEENSALISRLRSAAGKARRPELFDEDALAAHFDAVLPPGLNSTPALKRWLTGAPAAARARFRLDEKQWLPGGEPDDRDFPDAIRIDGISFPLEYRDGTCGEAEGLTCTARRRHAHLLRKWRNDWLVPGLLLDKLVWMISCLPAAQRRILSPAREAAARAMTHLRPGEKPLAEAFAAELARDRGLNIRPNAWDRFPIPPCHSVRFVVVDDDTRRPMASGRNLEEVLEAAGVRGGVLRALHGRYHKSWDFGDLPATTAAQSVGWQVFRHTAIIDRGEDGVEIGALDTEEEAEKATQAGLARLLLLGLGPRAASQLKLPSFGVQTLFWLKGRNIDAKSLAGDILLGAIAECAVRGQPRVLSQSEFRGRGALVAKGLAAALSGLIPAVCEGVTRAAALSMQLETDGRIPAETRDAVGSQLDWLFFDGFAARLPLERLKHYRRYLDAITIRLERARLNPSSDAARQQVIDCHWGRYRELVASDGLRLADQSTLVEYRWMVEELRVSLFAQELTTPTPVSEKRLDAKWKAAVRQDG